MPTVKTYFEIGRGVSGITEELIYNNPGDIPVISATADRFFIFGRSSEEHLENKGGLIEIPAILIVRVGKAGKTQIVDFKKFAVTENVLFLYPKKEFVRDFNLRWVENQLKGKLERNARGDINGQRNISAEIIYKIKFDNPNKNLQDEVAELTLKTENIKRVLVNTINQLHKTKEKAIFEDLEVKSFEEAPVEKIFHIEGGNSGLTEEFIYYNQPSNEEETIEIFTGATLEENKAGFISRFAKPNGTKLKIFQGPATLVVRKGLAGKMFYIRKDEFTTNDDAYVLTPKKDWEEKINPKWFIHEYQDLFFNLVTSKSDNATFDKEYASRQTVKIPDIDFQNTFVEKIEYMETIIAKLREIEKEIDEQLEYAIV